MASQKAYATSCVQPFLCLYMAIWSMDHMTCLKYRGGWGGGACLQAQACVMYNSCLNTQLEAYGLCSISDYLIAALKNNRES